MQKVTRPVLGALSEELYTPQNPADLVDALQEPIHRDVGRSRPARTVRKTMQIELAGIALEMVPIPGGRFLMGSLEDEVDRYDNEGPQHEVRVASFSMAKYSTTQAQWRVVAGLPQVKRELDPDPSRFKGDDRPVEGVSWYDVMEFCARLSALTGREYRLPSEAEWEYACRAGTATPFHFGETISPELANYQDNGTVEVGSFPPNGFGLHDMHGNVWEWCLDHFHDSYEGAPADGSAWVDAEADEDENNCILRGGSWNFFSSRCRCAYRNTYNPDVRTYNNGFRVVSGPLGTVG